VEGLAGERGAQADGLPVGWREGGGEVEVVGLPRGAGPAEAAATAGGVGFEENNEDLGRGHAR